jgi:hypothetical protein
VVGGEKERRRRGRNRVTRDRDEATLDTRER